VTAPASMGTPSVVQAMRRHGGPVDETTLERAWAGDGDAFQELVEPHRRELLVHCYRILGSLQDAEDVLQEALLAAWRALGRFDGRSLRAWLYRIATNRCLNYVRDGARRPQSVLLVEPASAREGLISSDEPWWLEPYPDALLDDVGAGPEARYDARESIALSFVAGLQHLPARQRAVLVLRDVLGLSASEVATSSAPRQPR
jgi:RNA polymerase sigma-70 factor (TIGR02960 family)